MIAAFNALNVSAACPGNHDFDKGIANFAKQVAKSAFPWYVSNLFEPGHNGTTPLAGMRQAEVLRLDDGRGARIGVLGLVEDWFDTIAAVRQHEYVYKDFVASGREAAKRLRAEGADIVVALTHMSHASDHRLAREVWLTQHVSMRLCQLSATAARNQPGVLLNLCRVVRAGAGNRLGARRSRPRVPCAQHQ